MDRSLSFFEIVVIFDIPQSTVSCVYQEYLMEGITTPTMDSRVADHMSLMSVTRGIWLELFALTDE